MNSETDRAQAVEAPRPAAGEPGVRSSRGRGVRAWSGAGVRLDLLLRPHVLCLLGGALSFAAWAVPWPESIRRGFEESAPFTTRGIGLVLLWYAAIALAAFAGWRLGQRFRPSELLERVEDESLYRCLVACAAVGVLASYVLVAIREPSVFVDAIAGRRFNEVREALPYAAGIQTLRYAAIPAGGIALALVLLRRRVTRLEVLSVALLLLTAAIASRLSIVLAILIALGVLVYRRPGTRVTVLGLVVVALVFFLVTTPLTYLRSGAFYRQHHGTGNPLLINAGEFVSYLGAPFQAALATANEVAYRDGRRLLSYHAPLLPNASFERGMNGWLVWSVSARASKRPIGASRGLPLEIDENAAGPDQAALVIDVDRASVAASVISSRLVPASDLGGATAAARLRFRGVGDVRARVDVWARRDADGRLQIGDTIGAWPPRSLGQQVDEEWQVIGDRLPDPVTGGESYVVSLSLVVSKNARGSVIVDRIVLGPVVRRDASAALLRYLTPTYLPFRSEDATRTADSYRNVVEIDEGLATNSSFARMVSAIGLPAFALIALVSFLAAVVAGHASRYASYVIVVSVIVAYCFAELWRTYLFMSGLIHFLVLAVVGAALLSVALPQVRRLLRRPS